MFSWRSKRSIHLSEESPLESSVDSPSSSSSSICVKRRQHDLWSSDDIKVAITNVLFAENSPEQQVQYEIILNFPRQNQSWKIRRTYEDFESLHHQLVAKFRAILYEHKIHLPRASRFLALDKFRAKGQVQKMLVRLNSYLHRLLELEQIYTSIIFSDFFEMRPIDEDNKYQEKIKQHCSIQFQRASSIQLPVQPATPPIKSLCNEAIQIGTTIQLRVCGGLRVGLTKKGGLSGKQKAAAVAAGVAGVALTGPLSAVLTLGALGGGVGKYQMNKTLYLSTHKKNSNFEQQQYDTFLFEKITHSTFSDPPPRSHTTTTSSTTSSSSTITTTLLKYGDCIHLHSKDANKSVKIARTPNSKRGFLMVTKAETNIAKLRLVSPYEGETILTCGSYVYIQVMNGEWANEYLSIYGNCIITSPDSPTAFKICMHSHQCHASEEVIRITRNVLSKCFSLRVMFYNIWMMPSFVTSIAKISPNTLQRAEVIPACIAKQNVDVVLFAEAFCSQGREILIRKMKKHGFLFETQVVGSFSVSQKKVIDGGVFAMSKYPMEHVEEISFGSIATGDDRMSDKGALYFQIRMNGEVVHFFGTHLQAWETQASIKVRKNQAEILKKFMDSMKISSKDAVILSGDLNVDRLSCEGKEEYEDILRKLDVADLEVKEGSEQKYSFDPLTNKLAIDGPSSGGKTEHLDYILYGKSYRQPKRAQVEVIHLKATNDWQQPIDASDFLSMTREEKDQVQDLSDHYPIVAEFHF